MSGLNNNNLEDDIDPDLGGNLDVNGFAIISSNAGNIPLTPDTTGSVILDGLSWPQADGTNGQVLTTDGAGQLSWSSAGGGGEINTAANIGAGGVGVYDSKSGVQLRFRNINAADAKITVTDDSANDEIDVGLGAVDIDDLNDVVITSATDGAALVYDNGSGTWIDSATPAILDGDFSGNGIMTKTGSGAYTTRTITGTSNEITVTNGNGVSGNPTIGLSNNPVIPGNAAVQLPSGTTAQRTGSPTNGEIRYNTSTSSFEGYAAGAWGALGGGSVSGDAGSLVGLNSSGTEVAFDGSDYIQIEDDFVYIRTTGTEYFPWSATRNGTGTTSGTLDSAITGATGVWSLGTGTTSTGEVDLIKGLQNQYLCPLGQGTVTMEWRVRFPTLADATDDYRGHMGGHNGIVYASSISEGIYFEYNRSNSVNWRGVCENGGTVTRTSGTDVTVGTGWHHLKYVVNAGGTSVEFFVDGTSIGTVSTNIPTNLLTPKCLLVKTAGTNDRTMQIDYFKVLIEWTSGRW